MHVLAVAECVLVSACKGSSVLHHERSWTRRVPCARLRVQWLHRDPRPVFWTPRQLPWAFEAQYRQAGATSRYRRNLRVAFVAHTTLG